MGLESFNKGDIVAKTEELANKRAVAEAKEIADTTISEAKEGIKRVRVGDFKTIVFYTEVSNDIKEVLPLDHIRWTVKQLPNSTYSIFESHPNGGILPGGSDIADLDKLPDDMRSVLYKPNDVEFTSKESNLLKDFIEDDSFDSKGDSIPYDANENDFQTDHNKLHVTSKDLISENVLEVGKSHIFTVLSGSGTKSVSTEKIIRFEDLIM